MLERFEEYEEALDCITAAIELDPDEPEYRLLLAEWLMAAGEFDDTKAQMAIVLSIDVYNREAKELGDRVRIRRVAGGDPNLTVFVHDRSEQLIDLLNLLMRCQAIIVRGCGQVEFELLTEGGEAD